VPLPAARAIGDVGRGGPAEGREHSAEIERNRRSAQIMNQAGHRSVQIVRRYIRDGSLFRENSAGKLGL
jgi:hypothetical protein